MTHKNIIANLEQVMSDYFDHMGKVPPPDTTLVSWLPFYHDMGLLLGVFAPSSRGFHAVLTSPMAFLQKPARWMQKLASNTQVVTRRRRTSLSSWLRDARPTRTWPGSTLGNVLTIISGSERIHAATIRRFTERFSRFDFPDNVLRPSYGLAEATLYVASSAPGQPPATVRFDYEKLSAGHAKRVRQRRRLELVSYGPPRASTRADRRPRDPDGESGRQGRARSGCTATTSPAATGESRKRRSRPSAAAGRSIAGHAARALAADRRSGCHVGR